MFNKFYSVSNAKSNTTKIYFYNSNNILFLLLECLIINIIKFLKEVFLLELCSYKLSKLHNCNKETNEYKFTT